MRIRKNSNFQDTNIPAKCFCLSECLAKLCAREDGKTIPGMDIETHSKLVGMIAGELLQTLPIALKSLFPEGIDLIAAVHDVGKINPLFQEKIRRTLEGYTPNSVIGLEYARPELEQTIGYHGAVSQAALEGVGRFIPEIAGRHHGSSPATVPMADDAVIGGAAWQKCREDLLNSMKGFFKRDWPKIQDDLHAAVISGLVTVADWIGSGPMFDQVMEIDETATHLAASAVEAAGFIAPRIRKSLSFSEVFPDYTPTQTQQAFVESVKGPGLYILEALMGEGKTEAALYAAYRVIEAGQAKGIYFALPSQLTSEKMLDRMNMYLDSILEQDDKHRPLLIHGKAWLVDTDMGEEAKPGYSWFNARKRKILSPFAVGTIDQAIMAVMNVKHGFVRTFGLAGKVVILDEVHTYDTYTGTILDHLVKCLTQLGCTVVLLSATLTSERRKTFLNQTGGIFSGNPSMNYPLITKAAAGKAEEVPVCPAMQSKVLVGIVHNDEDVIEQVRNKAASGEYVLWIENTVNKAQLMFKQFAAWGKENSIEVGLLHSRYPQVVRSSLDAYWVGVYGKEGIPRRKEGGKILIGTQVLEQSLDIDADFLVSRIAPSDMLLQRIGRLWRHRRSDPYRPSDAERKAVIISPSMDEILDNPLRVFGSTGKVYSPYVLVRSAEVWSRYSEVIIPKDMRTIIEETYAERQESGLFLQVKHELLQNKDILRRYAFTSLAKGGLTVSDTSPTRFSEVPSCDVLLLQNEYGGNSHITLIDGETVDVSDSSKRSLQSRKKVAELLMNRMISVPAYLAPDALPQQEMRWLSPYVYISDASEERVRIAVVKQSGSIQGIGGRAANRSYDLVYSSILGYSAVKK